VCRLCREAGTSILSFLIRLVEPSLLQSSAVLQSALVPRAAGLVRLLLAGVTGALPDWRCKEIGELIYLMLAVRRACTVMMASNVLMFHPYTANSACCRQCDSKPMNGSPAPSMLSLMCRPLRPTVRRLAKQWLQRLQGRLLGLRQAMQMQ